MNVNVLIIFCTVLILSEIISEFKIIYVIFLSFV